MRPPRKSPVGGAADIRPGEHKAKVRYLEAALLLQTISKIWVSCETRLLRVIYRDIYACKVGRRLRAVNLQVAVQSWQDCLDVCRSRGMRGRSFNNGVELWSLSIVYRMC